LISNNLGSGNGSGNVGQATSCTPVTNQMTEAPTKTFASYLGNGSDDLHLKSGSVAIQQGTTDCVGSSTGCVPTTDLAGLPRATPPSIGTYEFATSGASPSAPTNLTATVQ
jgi:hypothetical protein